ncbi:hypothetical protein PPL_00485 [Heterostelium album PN500]|uniref:C3H1-type domain-containing protein n=1 Tax=Heterostelium pallidum (strain ATCC 26659 / Pp 5 / PN500) TaxID=670386 RepID=D3AWL0_HETP5|nr:hypothetical protein PPL_00485 [Heterostelium album PN500]EFA86683.1 hypothetical protein PPL_00485 [Heterostelium album PN500]|eukprot:XP_020438787.1 hypothetical protein PPL_00485 [Heterostelium album PN500]
MSITTETKKTPIDFLVELIPNTEPNQIISYLEEVHYDLRKAIFYFMSCDDEDDQFGYLVDNNNNNSNNNTNNNSRLSINSKSFTPSGTGNLLTMNNNSNSNSNNDIKSNSNNSNNNSSMPDCKFFLNGACSNDRCAFYHDQSKAPIKTVCKYYHLSGECLVKNCSFLHSNTTIIYITPPKTTTTTSIKPQQKQLSFTEKDFPGLQPTNKNNSNNNNDNIKQINNKSNTLVNNNNKEFTSSQFTIKTKVTKSKANVNQQQQQQQKQQPNSNNNNNQKSNLEEQSNAANTIANSTKQQNHNQQNNSFPSLSESLSIKGTKPKKTATPSTLSDAQQVNIGQLKHLFSHVSIDQILESRKSQSIVRDDSVAIEYGRRISWSETGESIAGLYSQFRDEAILHARERNRCFDLSIKHFGKGEGEKAKKYSLEGREHDRKMKELHEKAKEQIFYQRNKDYPQNIMDLHGLEWLFIS